jgi:hypothetical protein
MAAAGYPKLVYWPTISFVDVEKRRVTRKPPQHQAFGNTNGSQFNLV